MNDLSVRSAYEVDVVVLANQVIWNEIAALEAMAGRMNCAFRKAIDIILGASGRVVVIGMGKSGIVGRKIVATLASTGTPSLFVHPGEAFHGDLGMIRSNDVALMISKSGETEELVRLLPFIEHQHNRVIAMTGSLRSTLSQHADVVLDTSVDREACNHNLAPTCSTTAALVMGDALAIVLSTLRGFKPEDFARFHPGGCLGRRLLTRVSDVMSRTNLPLCTPNATFRDIVHVITRGRMGIALVMEGDQLRGVITDGDIRRAFERVENPIGLMAADIMTAHPKTIGQNERLADAEEKMLTLKINALVVVDERKRVVGVLQIYSTDPMKVR